MLARRRHQPRFELGPTDSICSWFRRVRCANKKIIAVLLNEAQIGLILEVVNKNFYLGYGVVVLSF